MKGCLFAVVLLAAGCRSVPHTGVHKDGEYDASLDAGAAKAEGERLWEVDPRTVDTTSRSLDCFRRVVKSSSGDYEALWKGCRAAGWASERAQAAEDRKKLAMEGISLGDAAIAARPDGAEGHYYRALAMGALADVDHSYGLSAVTQMEKDCLATISADEKLDHAGAHRLVGILYLECPAPPVSIGSLRKAKKSLSRALELDAGYPPNHLWAGRLYREEGNAAEAKKEFQGVIDASVPAGETTEGKEWQKDAKGDLAK